MAAVAPSLRIRRSRRLDLTTKENNRLAALEAWGHDDPMTATRAANIGTVGTDEAATEMRIQRFSSVMQDVERKMLECEAIVSSGRPDSDATPQVGEGKRRASTVGNRKADQNLTLAQRMQRDSSQRLFMGKGFGGPKLPPRIISVPPLRSVESKLEALRQDLAARETLRLACIVYEQDNHKRAMRRRGGDRHRDFIRDNIESQMRPRSALPPPPSKEVLPIAQRPEWRPGGAKADIYLRPSSAPVDRSLARRPVTSASSSVLLGSTSAGKHAVTTLETPPSPLAERARSGGSAQPVSAPPLA